MGCAHDVYEAKLPDYLDGLLSFATLALILYQECGILALAITSRNHLNMRLFPSKTILKRTHHIFLLATNPDAVNQVESLALPTLQKYVVGTVNDLWYDDDGQVIPYNEIDADYMIDPDDSMVDKNDADDSPGECHPVEPSGGAPPLLESVQTVEPHTKQLLQKFSSHLLHVDGDAGVSTSGNVQSPATAANHADCFTSFLDQALPCSLSGHIILCGMPNALHDFIAPLRHQLDFHANSTQFLGSSQHAMTAAPIIVISQILLTEKQHASIAHFHQVYFICGSPLHEGVLRQASAFTAKSIVILSSCLQSDRSYDNDEGEAEAMAADTKDQNMLDTDAITLHRYIVDLRFLKDELVRAESPATLQAVKALTKRVLSRADDPLDNICHPIYAAGWPSFVHRFDSSCPGKVFISNSLDAVLGSCNKYGCIIDLLHLLTFGEGASNESGRMLDQIAVPLAYQDKSYLECFVQMLVTQHALTCASLTSHVEASSHDVARVEAVMSDDGSQLIVVLALKTPVRVDGYVFDMMPFAQDEANGQLQDMLTSLRSSCPFVRPLSPRNSRPASSTSATFVPASVSTTQDIRWTAQAAPQDMPHVVLSDDGTALVILKTGRFVVQWSGPCGPGLALFENDKRVASTRSGDFQHLSTVVHVERGVTVLRATSIRPLQGEGPSLIVQEV
ncbi:hypothetical protein DYB32_004952 [Aphanomyces invadans]|uniref:RCK N-terminal domain-containing protein n=1 Tax=Aphanomyces invadans TaxID=157072 RepID=A0A3R6VX97_9STRA|nr:hypothetical protein DYB32_004952 [Aphanomyces invadans]